MKLKNYCVTSVFFWWSQWRKQLHINLWHRMHSNWLIYLKTREFALFINICPAAFSQNMINTNSSHSHFCWLADRLIVFISSGGGEVIKVPVNNAHPLLKGLTAVGKNTLNTRPRQLESWHVIRRYIFEYIYIYIYLCVCVCVYICIHIYCGNG